MYMTIRYGELTPGGYMVVDDIINDSILSLQLLAEDLERNNYQLTAINKEGIIIKYIEPIRTIPDVSVITNKVHSLTSDVTYLYEELDKLLKINMNKDLVEPLKDITSEFFILLDYLPEHIKKELKIFIKDK